MNYLLLYDQYNTTIEVNIASLRSILDYYPNQLKIVSSASVSIDDLNWSDVCIAIRPTNIFMVRIMHAIKLSGRTFISTFDDDLLNLPKGYSERWKSKYALTCIKESDVVVTCNPLIQKSYKEKAPNPHFVNINAHIREDEIKSVKGTEDKIRVVYAAGKDHTELFDFYIKPSLDKLYNAYGEKLEMTLMGIDPNIPEVHKSWIEVIPSKPLKEYSEYMKVHDFDLGLAPLADTPFCNRKYFNKYIEYSKNGICGIYSNCLPYTLVVENGENGLLVDNSVEEWEKKILWAVEHIDTIKEMANNAQQQIRNDFSLTSARMLWDKEVETCVNQHRIYADVDYCHAFIQETIFFVQNQWHRFAAHVKREGLCSAFRTMLHISID